MFSEAEEKRIIEAIAAAERGNRAEVRVHVEERCPLDNSLERAKAAYHELGMDKTRDDTGVLLYVAVDNHAAAIYAGQGIYRHAEASFWQTTIDAVAKGYRESQPADGLCRALELLGEQLRAILPGDDDAGDELPNAITTSKGEA